MVSINEVITTNTQIWIVFIVNLSEPLVRIMLRQRDPKGGRVAPFDG